VLLQAAPEALAPMLLFVVSTHFKTGLRRIRDLSIALLVFSCALVMLVKFTFLIVILALCGLSAVQDLLHRRPPWIAGGVMAAGLGFWILARQSLSNLPEYFRNSKIVLRRDGVERPAVAALLGSIDLLLSRREVCGSRGQELETISRGALDLPILLPELQADVRPSR
jgi:hypothetical protein